MLLLSLGVSRLTMVRIDAAIRINDRTRSTITQIFYHESEIPSPLPNSLCDDLLDRIAISIPDTTSHRFDCRALGQCNRVTK